jgi:arginine/lysine/ornithine decarboxylase
MKTPALIKADMITVKLNQVNAAAEKHAAALAAYPAFAAADTAARAALHAAGGFNRAAPEVVNAERAARYNREAGEKAINSTGAIVRRRLREFNVLRAA